MSSINNPGQTGVAGALSGLTIDTNKDWLTYNITNLGQISVGDIEFANDWVLTEDNTYGVILKSPTGKKYKMLEVK